ncbi:hypothetical protein ACF0H5_007765 [Mactra antiquata]
MNKLLIVILTVQLLVGTINCVPPTPTWPDVYKSCVNVQSSREFIKGGWYVDAEQRRMRLDSYGIPKGMNESTAELLQQYIDYTEDFDYACSQYGPPLYIFIYLYDINKMLALFPAVEPPYRKCTMTTMYNKFPNSPLFPDVEFVEEGHDNITTYNHWRAEFFLFTLDYFFHTSNGLPYKMFANDEENLFLSVQEGELDKNTFQPPPGVTCT